MLKNIFYKIIFFKYYNLSTLSTPRSPEWRKLRKKHLKIYPACSVCGSTKNVVPHHIIPFNQDPSKELDPENLISLCENKFNCHLFFGHLKNWLKHNPNPNIVEDAETWRKKLNEF